MKPNLIIFDLDKTLVRKNTSYAFCLYLYRKKALSLPKLLYAFFCRLRRMPLSQLHTTIFKRLLFGFSMEILEGHAADFLDGFFKRSLYAPAVRALESAKKAEDIVVILSSSPSFLVAPAARFFGVDTWGATEYEVDKDRLLCKIANLMEGTEKASFVVEMAKKLKIDKTKVTVYTDSYLDLPLLNQAGSVVAVNPDSKLRSLALQRRWSII